MNKKGPGLQNLLGWYFVNKNVLVKKKPQVLTTAREISFTGPDDHLLLGGLS